LGERRKLTKKEPAAVTFKEKKEKKLRKENLCGLTPMWSTASRERGEGGNAFVGKTKKKKKDTGMKKGVPLRN